MVNQSNVETHKPFPKPLRERVWSTTKESNMQSHHHGNVEANDGWCTMETHQHVSEVCSTARTHTGHHMNLETTVELTKKTAKTNSRTSVERMFHTTRATTVGWRNGDSHINVGMEFPGGNHTVFIHRCVWWAHNRHTTWSETKTGDNSSTKKKWWCKSGFNC